MDYTIFDVKDGLDLFEKENYQDALEIFLKVYEQSLNEMKESGFLACYIAICYDYMRDHLEAAYWINKALALDPYCTRYEASAGIIYDNVECYIEWETLNTNNTEKVMNLFNFLKQNGRVKSNTQFVMIRFFMKNKNFKAAKEMLDNALERNPFDKDLLILRKGIAKDEGDMECFNKLIEMENSNLYQLKDISGTNQ